MWGKGLVYIVTPPAGDSYSPGDYVVYKGKRRLITTVMLFRKGVELPENSQAIMLRKEEEE
jgi:hypothetical protein